MKYVLLLVLALTVTGCTRKPVTGSDQYLPSGQAGGAATDNGADSITPDRARAAGVEILQAGPADIRETLLLYGTIRPNAERQREIRARYPGVIRSVARRQGDAVRKDEVLFSVESNDSLEPYAIRSPIAGTVLTRPVNTGEPVGSDILLMTIADLSSVWGEFLVFSREMGRVRTGQTVLIRSGEGGMQEQARIAYIAPAGDAATRSVVVRAEINNRDRHWFAGQFVTGAAVISEARVAVAVVPAALQQVNGKPIIFVQTGNGFAARTVEIGRQDSHAVEILNGLAAGEHYAGRNSFVVKAELFKGEAEAD